MDKIHFITKNLSMKKAMVMITTACILFASAANAQFSKGTVMLGTTIGSTGFSSANSNYGYDVGTLKSTGTNTFTFSVGPQVGVFLSQHLVFGATPSLNISTSHVSTTTNNTNNTTTGSTTSTTTTTVTIGPYLRYYFAGVPGNNWFYVQTNGALGSEAATIQEIVTQQLLLQTQMVKCLIYSHGMQAQVLV